jgi:hypothetical protein
MKSKKDKLQEKVEWRKWDRAWAIKYYLESESVHTTSLTLNTHFYSALTEVLERLPNDIFTTVEENIRFILESSPMWTMKYHFKRSCPHQFRIFPRPIDIYTIILLHPCLELSREALTGVIANEIAHSVLVCYPTRHMLGKSEEDLTEAWGFAAEIAAMIEAKALRQR